MPFTTFRVLVVQTTAFDIELLAFNASTEALAIPHKGVLPPPAGVCKPAGGVCCGALVWLPGAGACEPQAHVAPTVCKAAHATKVELPGQVALGHVLLSKQPPTLLEVQHCDGEAFGEGVTTGVLGVCCCGAGACEPQGHVLPTVTRLLHATTVAFPGQVWVGHVLLSEQPPTLLEVQHCARSRWRRPPPGGAGGPPGTPIATAALMLNTMGASTVPADGKGGVDGD